MKKMTLSACLFALASFGIAQADSFKSCVVNPAVVSVGFGGPGNNSSTFVVYDPWGPSESPYQIGLVNDDRSKGMYATALTAASMGRRLQFQYYNASTDCNVLKGIPGSLVSVAMVP